MISGNHEKCEEFDPQVMLSDDTHCFCILSKCKKPVVRKYLLLTNERKQVDVICEKVSIVFVKCSHYKAVLLNFYKCKHAIKL